LGQVDIGAIEMIGQIRTAWAARLPARAVHEVIDDELALAAEQIGEGFLAARPVENIGLLDLYPRQLAPLFAERIALSGEFLFRGEQRLARLQPLLL
jgi:hypothetical protein